ncbi:TOPRIM nucleotidyl transferase/hydrolase domain-containing protein [Georgenia sp. M64]|uniref:TOPRIM nucleotidyl transferase/hydrolase domain-containing protein n=1 Tax=Georgenia sp. M64 TaxID=3120520 RepID=UPI0030E06DBE
MVREEAAQDDREPAPVLTGVRDARVVALVEGVSDQVAVERLALRRGRDLAGEGVLVLPMGGATNVGHHLRALGRWGVPASGLLDIGEERFVRRGLASAGLGVPVTRSDLARAGFFFCVADLEDELIRALGAAATEEVLAANGDLALFRRFQRQPAQRVRPVVNQLHRFLGTTTGRKARYAGLLVEHLDLNRVPDPLDALLRHVTA